MNIKWHFSTTTWYWSKRRGYELLLILTSLGIFLQANMGLFLLPLAQAKQIQVEDGSTEAFEGMAAEESIIPEDWVSQISDDIRRSEYDVTWQENTYLSEITAAYQAPNRAHNLRTYFTPGAVYLVPRDEVEPAWEFAMSFTGYGYEGNVIPVAEEEAIVTENRLTYQYGEISQWYVNDAKGLEQGFTLQAPPRGRGNQLQVELALSGNLTPALVEEGTAVEFTTATGVRVLRYSDLYAFDAQGKVLPTSLRLMGCDGALTETACHLQLLVNDSEAVYPITIDPLLTTPSWTAESNQASANFGFSVSSAGDVNGDGYADVIVGASSYDNGQTNEGRAYVYHGSASGLNSTANWTAESNQASASFGYSVSSAGDVNGDGYADVIVGAYLYDNGQTNEGRAYVYHGSASGLNRTAAWTAESDQASAFFGFSVSSAGDVNGDGYADVIVGAHLYDNGQTNEGRAYVYHGSASGLNSAANWTAESNQASANFGISVSSAGDVNGDGYADVIVGAYLYDNGQTDEGRVYVYHGAASGLNSTANWTAESDQVGAFFGYSVSSAGDVNGDGYSDVIVGAYLYDNGQTDNGRVYVYHGSTSGLSSTANWMAGSDQAGAYFGRSVSSAGDVNGDGFADVIVGAYLYDNGQTDEGRAYVYHGSANGLSLTAAWKAESDQADAYFGYSVSSAGDVNGDGYSDVIVGAFLYDNGQTDEGRAYVYHGAASGLNSAANWTAESNQVSANFGFAVSSAGDVNGDGYADVIVGAYLYDNGQTNEGRAYVYHGSASGLSSTAAWTAESNQASANFGVSVSTAGDVNGDGYSDVIVGANLYDNGQTNEGRAYVYYGSASGLGTSPDWTAESDQANAHFGYSVSTAGDVNGDGYSDVIVGSPLFERPAPLEMNDEGKVYIYHGSATGLNEEPAWTTIGGQLGAQLGISVSSAGDVNGDGYSDIVVGAHLYDAGQSDEGHAFVYHGAENGLLNSPAWTAESNQANANFGISVSTAGDVNGDGYSDVIVGAHLYDNGQTNEGRAYVYHGSAGGLSSAANWTAESNQASANFGVSVSTAGDVNGDGYSDVIVGAYLYDNGQTDEGRAYVYHGSASGLSSTANWTAESNQTSAFFGYSVSTAGDVNGDGYSDVIVGAYRYDNGQTDEGRAYVYYGNENIGSWFSTEFASDYSTSLRPRQVQTDGLTPIDQFGRTPLSNEFQIQLYGRTALGGGKVKLEWQVAPLGVPFTSTEIISGTSAAWHEVLPITPTHVISQNITGLEPYTPYQWRARLLYEPGNVLGQTVSRWLYPFDSGYAEHDLRTGPGALPVADFVASPLMGTAPLTVTFVNQSSHAVNYEWDFGDNSPISTETSPSHMYTGPGTYSVVLTATNAAGSDALMRVDYITVTLPNETPVITITTPLPGAIVPAGNLQVAGQVADDGVVTGVTVNGVSATLVGDTFNTQIAVTGGNQTIDAVATDDRGAIGVDSLIVQVDNEGPAIIIQSPANEQTVYTVVPEVVISYADFLANVDTNTLNVTLTDENSAVTNITGDLDVTPEGAAGTVVTPLLEDMSYLVTVSVADTFGNNSTVQSTFYVPTDPGSITPPPIPEEAGWVTGYVYDSFQCVPDQTECEGLAGVTITAAEIDTNRVITPLNGTVVSGPDGFFAFPFAETGVYTLRLEKAGYVYGQREVAVVRGHSTATNAIYLTDLDDATTDCTNAGCIHNNVTGSIQVVIPAGAIPAGETITVRATLFEHVEFLPGGELPPGTQETYAFNLDGDSEAHFTKPITVSIANSRGFEPGTRIPLGYWNQDTLQWEHAGTGVVDETGDWVVMHVMHFSNYDCNDPIARPELDPLLDALAEADSKCSDGEEGCFINLKSGQLRDWVETPPVNVLGEPVALTLAYNTERAHPSALIDMQLDLEFDPNGVTLGNYVQYELYIEGQRTDTFTFQTDLSTSGEVGHFRYLWDGRNAFGELMPPGVYQYAVKFRIPYTGEYCYALNGVFGGPPDCVNGRTGTFFNAVEEAWAFGTVELNSQIDSSLGSGWVLEGQQALIQDEAGSVLVATDDSLAEYYNELNDQLEGRTQYGNVQPPVLGPPGAVPMPPTPTGGTEVSGLISQNTTWTTAGSPYIVTDSVTVADNVELTIDPGVQVMFEQYKNMMIEGTLTAIGSATQPITFTAYSDTPFQAWEKYTELGNVHAVTVDANGDIWFATLFSGHAATSLVVKRLSADLSQLVSFDMPASQDFAPSNLYGIAIDSLGQKWIATNIGAVRLVETPNTDWPILIPNAEVRAIAVDNDNIWFGTEAGINVWTPSGWGPSYSTTTTPPLPSNQIYALAPDGAGNMWVGTDLGLAKIMSGGGQIITYDTSNSPILGNVVEDIAVDEANIVWMTNPAADGGVSVLLNDGEWITYTTNNGLASPFVSDITIDRDGQKWIGYSAHGVSILAADNQTWNNEMTPRLAGDEVVDLAPAPNGDVWLAHDGEGATRGYGGGASPDGMITGGYWGTIQIGGGANPDDSNDSVLSYVTLQAGGANDQASLVLFQSEVDMDNLTIAGSGDGGLQAVNSGGFVLADAMISGNRFDGIHIIGETGTGDFTLTNVEIRGNHANGLFLQQQVGTIQVSNSTIVNNGGYGIYTDYAGNGNVASLQNSTVESNEVAARLPANTLFADNQWVDNTYNQIEFYGGTISADRAWPADIKTYRIMGDINVSDGATLTLPPGASLLFSAQAGLHVSGSLVAEGTLDEPIYLGEADAVSVRWDGITLGGGVPDSDSSILRYVIIQQANQGLVVISSLPTLDHLTFVDNDWGMVVLTSNGLTITDSNFDRNVTAALQNLTYSQPVNAINNYWGHISGPNHSGNPGLGEVILGNVIYDPWRSPVIMAGLEPLLVNQTGTDVSKLAYNTDTGAYTRLYPNGRTIYFDSSGNHDYTELPDGRQESYTYNPDGTVATMTITHPGTTYVWTWNFSYEDGKLTGITDPMGRTTGFEINGNGHLTQVDYHDGSSESFFYDSRGLMTQHVDQSEAVTSYTYDTYGRIQTETGPLRQVFDPVSGQTTVAAETRTFAPSDTNSNYLLINECAVVNPCAPPGGLPKTEDIDDQVVYGIGDRTAKTDEWGHVVEQTDSLDRTISLQRDEASRVKRVDLPGGDCIEADYDEFGNVLYAQRIPADQCALTPENRDPEQLQTSGRTYEPRFNQVKTMVNPDGETITYVYDYEEDQGEAGRVIRMEFPPVPNEYGLPVVPTISYTYNDMGLVETETNPRGTVTRYIYTQGVSAEACPLPPNPPTPGCLFAPGVTPVPGYITQVIEDDGGFAYTTTYKDFDALGNPQTIIFPGGHETHTLYDELGRVISETDVVGVVTVYEYDDRGLLVRHVVDYTADGVTGDNVATIYEYDGDGRLTYESTTADGLTLEHFVSYDLNGRMVSERDGQGHEIRYIYNDAGELTEMIDQEGHSTLYTYNDDGMPETITDAEGYVSRTFYDDWGRVEQTIQAEGELDLTTIYEYTVDNLISQVQAPDGTITCFAYDDLGQRTDTIQDCGPNGLNLTTEYAYDISGNLVFVTDPRGTVSFTGYDALNRVTLTRQDDGGLDYETTTTYDEVTGNVDEVTAVDGTITKYFYDPATNLLTSVCQDYTGLNLCTTYTYDSRGRQETVTDAEGVVQQTVYNKLSLPVQEIADATGLAASLSFEYDNLLNLIKVTDANGNITRYTYTARGQLETELYADNTFISNTYHPRGNLHVTTLQDGASITRLYDPANRQSQIEFSTGGSQSFIYDEAGRMTQATQIMDGHTTVTGYDYDALGNVEWTTQQLDSGPVWQTDYTYDYEQGERTISYPGGAERTYQLDSINRLDSVSVSGGPVIADYGYDVINHFNTIAYPGNGLTNRVDYDTLGRVMQMRINNGSSDMVDYGYTYDDVGNRTSMQRNHRPDDPTDLYTYDGLYQLTDVLYGVTDSEQTYELDLMGNRLALTEDGNTTDYGPNNGSQLTNAMNRYEEVEGDPIGYDIRGNVLADRNNVYTYDILNRQTSVTNGGGLTEYIYDARGRRVAKINGSQITHYIYDIHYQVIEERDTAGTVVATYTYGQGMDQPLTMARGGQTYYYHRDALGNITEVSNSSGAIVEWYEYDVYGAVSIYNGDFSNPNPLTASAIGNPYLYTGRQYDPESGNYYNRARYYSPELGRFLSMDPLGFDSGDYNLYRYALNNPTNFTDPSGEFAIIPFLLSAATEAAVDALMQATINYFMDPNIHTVGDAFGSIDWIQVAWAGASGLLPGGRLARAALVATGDVLIEALRAWSNCEEYTAQQALMTFAFGVASELVGEKLGDLVAKYGVPAVAAGLRKLGMEELAERLLRNADEVLDGSSPPSVCGINSFSADTVVMTDEGPKAISTLQVGDVVLAYNEATGQTDYYPVVATIAHEDPVVQYLTIEGEIIITTPNHPFYTADGEWVPAGKLRIGDAIRQADGRYGLVQASAFVYQPQPMYNLTVATAHTYFAGDGQWLVHNNNVCFRYGGRTAKNLTPRLADVDSGLSLSTTPGKGWRIKATQQELQNLGFIVIPDPTPSDPGHFLLSPGVEFQNKGWTLLDWASTRDAVTDDSSTWHPLTQLLMNLAESYP